MAPLVAWLFALRINELWYALPLVVVISAVYSASRYERPHDILVGSLRSALWVCCFMGGIFILFHGIEFFFL